MRLFNAESSSERYRREANSKKVQKGGGGRAERGEETGSSEAEGGGKPIDHLTLQCHQISWISDGH